MKEQKSKDTKASSKDCCSTNHHAHPSHMNPEIAAMVSREEHLHRDSSKLHEPERDKRAAAREIHTNGSTRKGDL